MMKNERYSGAWIVTLAYVMWGSFPLFWILFEEIDSLYVLSQRLVWSLLMLLPLILLTGKGKAVRDIFCDRKLLLLCFFAGILMSVNWGSYIFAVSHGYVLDASLGYFIEPIVVSMIGVL
ncbi:MAG: EamA family transporter, partial [Firmicutes bacterium]|nr:EamA family transporter [Bacillota bacterium]